MIQSGQRPTILQQLCSLPFEYFSDQNLSKILFPTLIACCFNNAHNRAIMEQEVSTLMLATFIESTIVDLQLQAVAGNQLVKPKATLGNYNNVASSSFTYSYEMCFILLKPSTRTMVVCYSISQKSLESSERLL